jgi:putative ABC transport system permease protein
LSRISEISAEMERIPDIQVVTMAQVMGTIMNLAASARSLLMTVIAITIIISAFGILNTHLMSVNERTREFGMLKAIGASGLDIGKMIMAETLIITVSGGVIGVIMAVAGSSIIEGFVMGIIPYSPRGSFIYIRPELVGFSILFSVALGMVCGVYPALKSSRLTPMEAIRGGIE